MWLLLNNVWRFKEEFLGSKFIAETHPVNVSSVKYQISKSDMNEWVF
jgi:hypothetical protein